MQITVTPSEGYFIINSNGEYIPLGAQVDVIAGTLRYINAYLSSITVGAIGSKAVLESISLYTNDSTVRHYDASERYKWDKWDGEFETISADDLDEISLSTIDADASALYDLATQGLSKDEFIKRFIEIAARDEDQS